MKKTFTNMCVLLFLSFISLAGYSQELSSKKTITGSVVDFSGVPMPGVNIIEKGTGNGLVSDFDGKYSITVKEGATLVFSYIGMLTEEVIVGEDDTVINITLKEDISGLEEVIVVGYATQKREAVTGAIATINPSEIEDLPVGNLASAIRGRVLGVSVSGGESRPGNGARIVIRNPETFSKDGGSTSPLYVIDGIIQIDPDTGFNDDTLFNNLDASEVESISFLKDASAAVYGSRASQGVVLVKTKRGKKGPAKFRYSGNYSIADETYRPEMMSAYDFGRYVNIYNGPNGEGRAFDVADANPERDYFYTPNELEHFKTTNYDLLDKYWSSAATQRHNINVSGGSDNGTYFAGISYFTQEGNLGTVDFDRWSFRAGSSINLSKGFTADFQVSGFFSEKSTTFNKIDGSSENDEYDYQQLLFRQRFLPEYIDGMPIILGGSSNRGLQTYHYDVLRNLDNIKNDRGNNVTVNATIAYEFPFIKGLKVQGRYARTESKNRGTQLGHKYKLYEFTGANVNDDYIYYESGSGALGTNSLDSEIEIKNGQRIRKSNVTKFREQMNFQTAYSRDFGKHSISGLFVIEKSESTNNEDIVMAEGDIPEWATGQLWEVNNRDTSNSWTNADESGDLGYIGRLNYHFDDKYFAEFLFRSDASTKFAPENYWGRFYSLSGGWIISKENFFNSDVVNYLKLRGSVGLLGKDDVKAWSWVQRFGYQGTRGFVSGNNNIEPGLRSNAASNRDISWSDELKINVGVDTRLLDNRLSLNLDSYYNFGTGILIGLTQGIPFTVGGAAGSSNYAEFDTYGTEIAIGWNDYIGKDFKYGIIVNTGWSDNKLIKGDFADESLLKPWDQKPGKSTNIGVWGYSYQGMFRTQEEANQYVQQNQIRSVFGFNTGLEEDGTFNAGNNDLRPGMLYYKDVRGQWDPETRTFGAPDGVIDENDQVRLRKPTKGPTGFAANMNFGYKNFSLNVLLNANWGGYNMLEPNFLSKNKVHEIFENRPAYWADAYDPEINPNGTLPNPSKRTSSVNFVRSDFWAVNNNFEVNIRNINLGYTLPKTITEKLRLSSLRMNLVAINPFILSNPFKEYGLGPTGEYATYPILKTYSLGISVGF